MSIRDITTMKVKQKMKYINEKKIEELAKDRNNLVYRYADRGHEVKNIMPIDEVRDHILELFDIVQTYKITPKNQNSIRTRICRTHKKWEGFATSHPIIFESLVNVQCTKKTKETYLQILFIKKMELENKIDNGRQMIEDLILKDYGVPEAEYRANNPDSKTISL